MRFDSKYFGSWPNFGDVLFDSFKWWRKLRGGLWVKSSFHDWVKWEKYDIIIPEWWPVEDYRKPDAVSEANNSGKAG